MGLTGHIPESLNRHPNIPTTVPASSHDYAFLVPFAPPGFKLRRQGNLTSGGFLDGAHWAYTVDSYPQVVHFQVPGDIHVT